MLIKQTYSNKLTLNTGNYENENPFYSVTIEYDQKDVPEGQDLDLFVSNQFEAMKNKINAMLVLDAEKVRNPKKPLSHHRFDLIDGIQYPHVTNIITPVTPEIPDIDIHAQVGTLLDQVFKNYIEEGVFVFPEHKLTEKWSEMLVDCFNGLKSRLESNKEIVFNKHSIKVVNKKHVYCGEMDADGLYNGISSVFDCKKTKKITKDLAEKYFKQMAAYAMGDHGFSYKQLVVVSPYAEPKVTDKIEEYYNLFLIDRENYKKAYGV